MEYIGGMARKGAEGRGRARRRSRYLELIKARLCGLRGSGRRAIAVEGCRVVGWRKLDHQGRERIAYAVSHQQTKCKKMIRIFLKMVMFAALGLARIICR